MSADGESTDLANPLERFTSGGWLQGLLRLLLGAAIVAAVVLLAGHDSLALLADRRVALPLSAGALVHLVQRAARIRKWWSMIAPTDLVSRSWLYLLRIQLIGMVANLLLPVSEALKIWAVSRDKRQALLGAESIAADMALHCLMVGVAGLLAALATGMLGPAVVGAAAAVITVSSMLLAALHWWPGRRPNRLDISSVGVLGWTFVETICQLVIYSLAVHAIGVDVSPLSIVALAPVLFISDLFMLTPAGLGLREALFTVVLSTLSGASPDAAVAVGLVISSMVFIAAVLGGGIALLVPKS